MSGRHSIYNKSRKCNKQNKGVKIVMDKTFDTRKYDNMDKKIT